MKYRKHNKLYVPVSMAVQLRNERLERIEKLYQQAQDERFEPIKTVPHLRNVLKARQER